MDGESKLKSMRWWGCPHYTKAWHLEATLTETKFSR